MSAAADSNMADTAAVPAAIEHKENGDAAAAAAAAAPAAAAAAPSASSLLTLDVPPSQTLYVNNLNEKIKKVRSRESAGWSECRAGD